MITFSELREKKKCIAVLGLGYVGLPLAVKLSKHFKVIGFDISRQRIEDLKKGVDPTREVSAEDLAACDIKYSFNPS